MDIGDTVLHPRYGVGVIDSIESREQDGKNREFYVIPKPSISSTIFVPVEAADELGLRPVATPQELEQAIRILSGESQEARAVQGLRSLSWGDPLALAQVIRRQATEPKSRYPKVSEQHQLKRARRLLAEELSAVLGMSEESISALVDPGQTAQRKHA